MLHILAWRVRHPKHHAIALLEIFIGFPLMGLLFWKIPHPFFSWAELYAILLLHASLSFAYIQVYPASQADSPSFKILLHVGKSMPQGMSALEIRSLFSSTKLLDERIHDLINSDLICEESGKLALTTRGKWFVMPFMTLRKILGLSAGAG